MILEPMFGFLQRDKQYFKNNKQFVTERNGEMVIKACGVYGAILFAYTIFTLLTGKSELLLDMYLFFDCIHIVLCGIVYYIWKSQKVTFVKVQHVCVGLEISLLTFFALEGAYASNSQHSLYIPIAILMIIMLFIHRAFYVEIIIVVYLVGFVVLSYLNKTPLAFSNDRLIAIATFGAANIGYFMIAQMRYSEAAALNKYAYLSKTDQLTSLLNKTTIMNECSRLLKAPEHPFTFVILDLDRFKDVNDMYGHDVGDEVLIAVATAIRSGFRGYDYIGRFGGDEFIILLDNCVDEQIISDRVKATLERISELRFTIGPLRVKACAGATIRRSDDERETIFKRADEALYAAKDKGTGEYILK